MKVEIHLRQGFGDRRLKVEKDNTLRVNYEFSGILKNAKMQD